MQSVALPLVGRTSGRMLRWRMPKLAGDFAVLGRFTDARVAESAATALAHLHSLGLSAMVLRTDGAEALAAGVPGATVVDEATLTRKAGVVLAVGGDGTLLYAARIVAGRGIPLLGINRGRLGFLTDVLPQDIAASIDEVVAGDCEVDDRPLLAVRLLRASGEIAGGGPGLALNDVVLQKVETGRILEFETWIDDRYVNTHGGDGIVIAGATGSTAYALSCGGPIVEPHLDVMVVAPICPHTLSDRPIVVSRHSTVEVRLIDRADTQAQVTVDGTLLGDLAPGDRLQIGPSAHSIRFLHPQGYDYYRLLRSKLHWGRGGHDNGR